MATLENLKDAFAGESRANQKYLAFAERAEQEGYPQVANLFRAAAAAEATHARVFLHVMAGIGPTVENLEEAINGESFEFKDMYPCYAAAATEEKNPAAVMAFDNATAVEQVHHSLYVEAMNKVKAGDDLPPRRFFVCRTCGDTTVNQPPETCPVCSAPKDQFDEIK